MSLDNLRALLIFSSYLGACFLLAVLIIRPLISRFSRLLRGNVSTRASKQDDAHQRSRIRKVILFATLALASLVATWYHMFRFFRYSYREWITSQKYESFDLPLSDWLKDSSLFEEAWSSAMATPERFWWTQQIFIFTTLLAIDIGFVGKRDLRTI